MRRRHQRRVALLSFFLAPRARAPKYRGTRHVTADGARELQERLLQPRDLVDRRQLREGQRAVGPVGRARDLEPRHLVHAIAHLAEWYRDRVAEALEGLL